MDAQAVGFTLPLAHADPAGQVTQELLPVTDWYVPAAQAIADPPTQYDPVGQVVQLPAPPREYVVSVHTTGASAPRAHDDPAVQLTQEL